MSLNNKQTNKQTPNPPGYELVLQLLFYKDGVRIKLPTKVDMPLNKVTETNDLA